MSKLSDQQLLRDYAASGSETAFAELVTRYVDLVYSAALRMMPDADLAKDVTQGVFMALAANAPRLVNHPVLSGWVYRAAQNIAAQTVRTDVRRRAREQEAAAINEMLSAESDPAWKLIAPHLENALGELNEADRDAVLLRYFEKKSAREMADILGIGEGAAQKRVNRAVERLRELLGKRGVSVGAAGFVTVLSGNAVQAAPAGLTAAISAPVFPAVVSAAPAIAAGKITIMTTVQKIAMAAAYVLLAGAAVYEARQAALLRQQNREIQQRQLTLSAQMQQMQIERDDATNRLAMMARSATTKPDAETAELLKLRGQVGQLRDKLEGLPAAQVAALKQKLAQMPGEGIPELALLKEKDWEKIAWNADFTTDDGTRVALSEARNKAVDVFFNLARPAIKAYLAVNNNILPSDLLPLAPYFDVPGTDAMLERYSFLQSGELSTNLSGPLVTESAGAVDPLYDSQSQMSMSGASGSMWNNVQFAVGQAVSAFSRDNSGQPPTDSSQITSYLKEPIEPAALQKYFSQVDFAANLSQADAATLAPAISAYGAANDGKFPESSSDLLPYLSTPAEQAVLQKLRPNQDSPGTGIAVMHPGLIETGH